MLFSRPSSTHCLPWCAQDCKPSTDQVSSTVNCTFSSQLYKAHIMPSTQVSQVSVSVIMFFSIHAKHPALTIATTLKCKYYSVFLWYHWQILTFSYCDSFCSWLPDLLDVLHMLCSSCFLNISARMTHVMLVIISSGQPTTAGLVAVLN